MSKEAGVHTLNLLVFFLSDFWLTLESRTYEEQIRKCHELVGDEKTDETEKCVCPYVPSWLHHVF